MGGCDIEDRLNSLRVTLAYPYSGTSVCNLREGESNQVYLLTEKEIEKIIKYARSL